MFGETGTGNGMAKSVLDLSGEACDAATATFAIIRGNMTFWAGFFSRLEILCFWKFGEIFWIFSNFPFFFVVTVQKFAQKKYTHTENLSHPR